MARAVLIGRQKAVFDRLCRADRPLGAYALLDLLRAEGFNSPMQVYRALHALVEKGVIHRLETLNAYVPCLRSDRREHGLTVLAICTMCGRLGEFSDEEMARRLIRWSRNSGFRLESSMIEVQGTCLACRHGQVSTD